MPIRIDKEMMITDPVHGQIPCSAFEQEILDTPTFNRLHHVLQSSMLYRTFPGNSVKRFEHSLGVMHLAGEMFFNAVCNTSPQILQTFFEKLAATLNDWADDVASNPLAALQYRSIHEWERGTYRGRPYSAPYPEMPLFNRRIPASLLVVAEDATGNSTQSIVRNVPFSLHDLTWMYLVVFQSVRLAGLLHDVGHLPYSHILEHIMDDMHMELVKADDALRNAEGAEAFEKVVEQYAGGHAKVAFHEQLGITIWRKVYDDLMKSLSENEQRASGFFLAAVVYVTDSILRAEVDPKVPHLLRDLHGITASVVDADRMDYCVRDAQAAGLSSEGPFYQRIISTLQMQFLNPDNPDIVYKPGDVSSTAKLVFCPSIKSVPQIEKLLERRWEIFTQLNFHHRVHKHGVLMQRLLMELGLEELREEIPELRNVLPLQVSSIWKLADAVQGTVPADMFLLQMDDSWLETLINHKYFIRYSAAESKPEDPTWNKFDELMSGRRRYKSLIKRADDYRDIDEAFYSYLVGEREFGLLHEMSMQVQDLLGGMGDPQEPDDDLHALYDVLQKNGLYALNVALELLGPSTLSPRSLAQALEARARAPRASEEAVSVDLVDVLVADSTFGTGISSNAPVYVARHNGRIEPLSNYTRVQKTLTDAKQRRPVFHVYYVPAVGRSDKTTGDIRRRLHGDFGRLAAEIVRERYAGLKQ